MKQRLGILLLLAAMLSLLAWQLRLETRLSVFFLGRSDPGSQLVERFQRSVFARRYLLALEAEPGKQTGLPGFSRQFITAVADISGVTSVWPAFQPPFSIPEVMAGYAPYAPLIYSLNPEEAAGLLAINTLSQRAEGLKRALLSPFGDLVQRIAPHDPLLLTLHAFADWRDSLDRISRQPDDFFPILLETRFEPFDAGHQQRFQQALRQVFSKLNHRHGGAYRLRMTGVPVFAVAAQRRIKQDVNRVTLASGLGVITVLLVLFRSWRTFPAIGLVLGFACAAGGLATQWSFGNVHGLTLALGATLIGVCVDYPIHLLAHCRNGSSAHEVARRLWPVLTLGAVTTVIGYLALAATGYPGFQQIAVFAAAGIVAALLTTLFVVPHWLNDALAGPSRLPMFDAWQRWCQSHTRLMRAALGTLMVGALLLLPRLQWLDDLERLAGIDARLRQEDRELRMRLGGIEPGRAVLVQAEDMETALQRGEAATRILRRLKSEGKLTRYYGIYPWLVSKRLQRANWEQYRQHVTAEFIAAWRDALSRNGLAVEALGLSLPQDSPELWLGPEKVLDSQLKEILPGQIDQRPEGVHLALWLGPHDPAAVAGTLSDLEGIRYFSQRKQINTLAERYRKRASVALSGGVGVILLLMLLRYRSPVRATLVLMPGLAGLIFIFASFSLLEQPVSFFHLIAAMLAAAICVDYGIFYTERRAGDVVETYRAMGASMLTTVAAFAALGLADNLALKALSIAVTGGVVTGYLLCPVLLRGK